MHPILKMVLHRLALGLLTLFVVSVIIFSSVSMLPGDLAQEILGQSATPATVAAFRKELGLNQPAHIRYLHWLEGMVHGNFGQSLATGQKISSLISGRLGNTLFLAALAAIIAIPIAVTLGILTALFRNTIFDRAINLVALGAVSSPDFFAAYVMILFLAVKLRWFPSIANVSAGMPFWDRVHATLLPALTLTLLITAYMMRMTRASIINLLASPYIEMAKLKGMSNARIILHHALPNALSPIINVIVLNLAYLIVGVVVVEVVFVYPGLGQLLVDSVSKRDVPVVQACSMIFAVVYILLNLLADILSTVSNPRLLHRR